MKNQMKMMRIHNQLSVSIREVELGTPSSKNSYSRVEKNPDEISLSDDAGVQRSSLLNLLSI